VDPLFLAEEAKEKNAGREGRQASFDSFWNVLDGCDHPLPNKTHKKSSVAGTRTRVFRVRAEYPDQLDYNGSLVIHVFRFFKIESTLSEMIQLSISSTSRA
jgi:hypothetical protein